MIGKLSQHHLKGLLAVDALARNKNMALAAKELKVSSGAISKHIINIERNLGIKLFIRSREGLLPRNERSDFFHSLNRGFRLIGRSLENLDGNHGEYIRLSLPPVFAKNWLMPRLSRFHARHPEIRFCFDAEREIVDIAECGYHCAVRFGNGAWRDVNATKIMDQVLFPVCNLDLKGTVKSVQDLSKINIITSENLVGYWRTWLKANQAADLEIRKKFTLSDEDMCLGAAIGGLGVTITWQTQAIECLKSGQLTCPLPSRVESGSSYWLITPKDRSASRAMSLFRNWMNEEAAASNRELSQLLS